MAKKNIESKAVYQKTDYAPKLVTDSTLRQEQISDNDGFLQKIFWALSAIIGMMLIAFSFKSGVNADDAFQVDYSEKLIKWYTTFGSDTSALNIERGNMHFYGGFFEVIAGAFNHAIGRTPDMASYHDTRHVLIALFGLMTIIFTALLAKEIMGWKGGILALLFASFAPYFFGNALMNPKDIPFCAGFAVGMYSVYMLLQQMPIAQKRFVIGAILGIVMAFGTRAGGLLLVAYYGIFALVHVVLKNGLGDFFSNKSLLISYIKTFLIIVIAGYFGALLFWPYGLISPLKNPFTALSEFEALSIKIRVLFEGNAVMSNNLPWYYPISSIIRSIPLYALLGLGLSFPLSYFLWKKYSPVGVFMAFFVAIFPVFYVILKHSILHNGWRHLLFVWPGIVLLSTMSFMFLKDWLAKRNENASYAVYALAGLLMIMPLVHIFKNSAYPYIYYNEAFGGVKAAFGQYETDYWGVSVRKGVEYLEEKGVLGSDMQPVTVASSMVYALEAYTHKYDAKPLKRAYVRYANRDEKPWDYAIFPSLFVSGEQIRSGNWPMKSQVVHTVEVDGVPILVVMKQDSAHYAFKGEQAIKQNDVAKGLEYFQLSVSQYPDNEEAWFGLANCQLAAQNYPDCKKALDKALKINPVNPNVLNLMYEYYQRTNNKGEADKIAARLKKLQ